MKVIIFIPCILLSCQNQLHYLVCNSAVDSSLRESGASCYRAPDWSRIQTHIYLYCALQNQTASTDRDSCSDPLFDAQTQKSDIRELVQTSVTVDT